MTNSPAVIGLDISLTSTGISDGEIADAIQPGPLRGEERMSYTLAQVSLWMHPGIRLAVVEGPSFGSLGPGHDELAGLRWMVRHQLWRADIPIAIVAPTALKKYTTGNGKASKVDMAAAAMDRWGLDLSAVKVGRGRYDMVDAYALARMGVDAMTDKPYVGVQWPHKTPLWHEVAK